MTTRRNLTALATLTLALAAPVAVKAEVISLDTRTLPSTQGWRYAAYGEGSGIPETSVYTVGTGVLRLNSIGVGMAQAGGNWYEHLVNLSPGDHWSMTMVAQVLTFESIFSVAYPFGLCFGANTGIAVGFGSDNIQYVSDRGVETATLPTEFDAGVFNTYRLDVSGGLQTFSINGTLVFTDRPTPPGTPSGILFGDGTGYANTRADIQSFVFTSAVPEPGSGLLWPLGISVLGASLQRHRGGRPLRSVLPQQRANHCDS